MVEAPSLRQFDATYDRVILGSEFFEGDEYYRTYRDRYRNTMSYLARVGPKKGMSLLDIGSGQFALLAADLFGVSPHVADIDLQFSGELRKAGASVYKCNLSEGPFQPGRRFDIIVLAEVIEHIPRSPITVLRELRDLLEPGGVLLLTTPNFFRLRNLARMLRGQEVLDLFLEAAPDNGMGHFVEYSLEAIRHYAEAAGYEVECAQLDQLSTSGSSQWARLARKTTLPLVRAVPRLRDNIVMLARNPS